MIQFNLLPDVKLEYIKAQRSKRLIISTSVIASVVAVVILLLLIVAVDGLQKKNMNDLNRDIGTASSQLTNTPNLNKILTVQNQLSSLPNLYAQDPTSSRLFGYLSQITPSTVTISNLSTDFTQNTMSITGAAPNLDDINTFTDTLKFTTYKTAADPTSAPAFTNVVLSSFNRSATGATYTITFSFAPAIFSNASSATLTVPNTVTTRSVTEQPNVLFKSGAN